MKHEGTSSPSWALEGFCSWNVNSNKWWLLRGIIFCLIRFGWSRGGTRLLIQFSFTKPCRLLWVLSPPPLQVLLSPSSIPSSLVFLAQARVISATPLCSFSSGTETRFQGDEQNRWSHTSQPLGVVKHLGSGLLIFIFFSQTEHVHVARWLMELMKKQFCSPLDVLLLAASANRINNIFF